MSGVAASTNVRHNLVARLDDARARTDALFGLIRPEALYDRPIPERHRIVFYIGHLEAFDWNLLAGRVFGLQPFHPEFDRLFAFGIDPVGGRLPTDQPSDWPRLPEIQQYNNRLREILDSRLGSAVRTNGHPLLDGVLLNVAIEHRLMHAETLACMLHQLPLNRKTEQPAIPVPVAPPLAHRMAEIPVGTATLGLSRNGDHAFGWDNEFEAHAVDVPSFAIDVYKVKNGDFLRFVREGGYSEPNFWCGADWEWINSQGIRHPKFWSKRDGSWFYRTMFDELPLPADWPVYVSQAEAAAYARWVGKALPTEAQWHRAAYGTLNGSERAYPWGDEAPDATLGNFDFHRWDPVLVSAYPASRSAFGVEQMVGNGWEWTSTPFEPFPGFEPFPFYRGYSADFFDGKHYVLKGGSARTAACLVRRSFRNWFQPHYPFVYASFRCVSK